MYKGIQQATVVHPTKTVINYDAVFSYDVWSLVQVIQNLNDDLAGYQLRGEAPPIESIAQLINTANGSEAANMLRLVFKALRDATGA